MDFAIDRALPMPIRQQLKGLIEYGVACGDLRPGEALPSVRDLALQLGIAPMTVSQVYADLKGLGLIVARAGAGTFVANGATGTIQSSDALSTLHRGIDRLIDDGLSLGLRTSDLIALINARLAARTRHGRRKSIAVVGLFPRTTARYAKLIAAQIGPGATVEPATMDAIQRHSAVRSRIASSDLVVTFFNRQREVASLLPGARVTAIRFVPAEETRRALASIPPGSRLLLLARVSEFLPIMKAGVMRFANGVDVLHVATDSSDEIAASAASVDIVVFASGTEDSLKHLPHGLMSIEYSHIPDPIDVRSKIEPVLTE